MIKVENAKECKKELKKLLKGCYCCTLKIDFLESGFCDVTISGKQSFSNSCIKVTYKADSGLGYNSYNLKTIYVTAISILNPIWDMIFSGEGFIVECYEDCYSDIEIINKSNAKYRMSQIVFRNTKTEMEFKELYGEFNKTIIR